MNDRIQRTWMSEGFSWFASLPDYLTEVGAMACIESLYRPERFEFSLRGQIVHVCDRQKFGVAVACLAGYCLPRRARSSAG